MKIVIPTRRRWNTFLKGSLKYIPKSYWRDTVIAVHKDEHADYMRMLPTQMLLAGMEVWSYDYNYIPEKRAMIGMSMLDKGIKKFCMIDDDLVFLIRRDADHFSMRNQEDFDTEEMFAYIDTLLNTYAHGAISPREGNNRVGDGPRDELNRENTRAMRFHFFRTHEYVLMEHSRLKLLEDFDITLQMLRRGYKNIVPYWYAQGQAKTQYPGGCSIYRDNAMHDEQVRKLRAFHPDFVRLRHKQNKTDADGFGSRTEVTIQWKAAYESSLKNR